MSLSIYIPEDRSLIINPCENHRFRVNRTWIGGRKWHYVVWWNIRISVGPANFRRAEVCIWRVLRYVEDKVVYVLMGL